MQNKKTICCIADAPGPAEMLAPVIPLLANNAKVVTVGVGMAFPILGPYGALLCDDEEAVVRLFERVKPDVIVSAISSLAYGPYIENALIGVAQTHSVPVVCLQDIWGNHRWPQNKDIASFISAVCVIDEFAASLWKQDGFDGDIIITGSPAFDRFAGVDVKKERNRLRRELNLQETERMILYAGQGTPHHLQADKKTFQFACDAIRLLAKTMPVKLIARHHPRAEEFSYYDEYSRGIETIDTSNLEFADELVPAVDVVISMSSTLALHACFLRIPSVSVLLPKQGRAMLKSIGLDDFPANLMGASIGIYDDDPVTLKETLEKIFTDESFRMTMREAQQKNFPTDRGAGERVAEVVRKFL